MRVTPQTCFLAAAALISPLATSTTFAQQEPETEATQPQPQQEREFRFELGFFGGAHFYASDHGLGRSEIDSTDISPDHNVAFGGRLGFNFSRWVTLEGEVMMSPTRTRDRTTDLFVFGYRGSVLVHLYDSLRFRPFVLVGYGGMTSVSNNENVVRSDTDGMLHAGLGAKFGITDRVGLRLEGRILAPPAFAADIVPVGSETGFGGPDFEALASIYFNFGEVSRSQYVVKREVVMMPAPPAPPPPPPPAPVADPDPDGDGIAGDADKCPLVAEDKDGFEDEDGCPDPDNDGDGIPDLRDKCPNEPETVNEYEDEDGCPDEVPVEVKKFTGVIEGINFKTASATILPGSFALLDRAVKVLKDYPAVNLEISGHTDSRGSEDYNRDLGQKRADSVKNYFVSQGVATQRLVSIGYGEDRPVADNATSAGRSRNRRTEFRLIRQAEQK